MRKDADKARKKRRKKKERKIIKIKAICHYSHLHSAMDYYNNAARPSSPSIGFYYAVATLRGCLPFYTYELAVFFLRPFLPFSFILFFTSRTCSPSVRWTCKSLWLGLEDNLITFLSDPLTKSVLIFARPCWRTGDALVGHRFSEWRIFFNVASCDTFFLNFRTRPGYAAGTWLLLWK